MMIMEQQQHHTYEYKDEIIEQQEQYIEDNEDEYYQQDEITGEESVDVSSVGTSEELLDTIDTSGLTHRNKVVREIISSERSYIDHINHVISQYLEPLRHNRPAVLESEYIVSIFNCIEKIKELSEQLIKEMMDALENGSENVALPFLDKKAWFDELYIPYGKNHGISIELISKLREKKPSFEQFLQTVRENQKSNRLDLQSYLIMPIQRMPRYKLLLKELLDLTENDHQDYNDIQAALQMIAATTKCVNEEIRLQENKLKVEKIQNNLTGGPRIVSETRLFVREGQLMKVCRKVSKPRWFFLFTDSLVYATAPTLSADKPTAPVGPAIPNSTNYTFHRMMMLNDVKIKDLKDKDNQKNAFQIISSTEKSFTVYSETPKEKGNWFEDFKLLSLKIIDENQTHDLESVEVPVWIPDKEAHKCMFCNDNFTIINRRHHCRNCGKVVCGGCSPGKKLLAHVKKNKPVRVCLFCYDFVSLSEKEKEEKVIPFSQVVLSHTQSTPQLTTNPAAKHQTISRLNSILEMNNKKRSNSTNNIPTSPDHREKDKDKDKDDNSNGNNSSPTHNQKLGGTLRRLKLAIKPSDQYKTMKKEKEKEKEREKDYSRTQSEPFLITGNIKKNKLVLPITTNGSQTLPSSNGKSSSSPSNNNNNVHKIPLPMASVKTQKDNNNSTTNSSSLSSSSRNDLVLSPTPPAPTSNQLNNSSSDTPPPRRNSRAGSQPPLPSDLKKPAPPPRKDSSINLSQELLNNNNNNVTIKSTTKVTSKPPTPPPTTTTPTSILKDSNGIVKRNSGLNSSGSEIIKPSTNTTVDTTTSNGVSSIGGGSPKNRNSKSETTVGTIRKLPSPLNTPTNSTDSQPIKPGIPIRKLTPNSSRELPIPPSSSSVQQSSSFTPVGNKGRPLPTPPSN